MNSCARALAAGAIALVLGRAASAAEVGLTAYRSMDIEPANVLNGSVLTAQVVPGAQKQVIALVTYLTGKRDEAGAVGVRLEVFRKEGDRLESIWARDYAKESGGFVGRGEIQVVDLDGDGVGEIFVTYDSVRDRLVQERKGELLAHQGGGFRVAWSGSVEYDATRAARDVPADRRDRFSRKLDVPATLGTKGVSVIFSKTVIAVAGERLAEPRVTREAFPLGRGAETR